jgi:hypothetical protein
MLCHNDECHYAEGNDAVYHNDECHYPKCRGAGETAIICLSNMFSYDIV